MDLIRTKCLDVPILICVRLGAGVVILVGSYQRHKVGQCDHPEITRRGGGVKLKAFWLGSTGGF